MSYDDYEQSERVQEWLRHNGVAIIVGIVIGLALIFGYRQWDQHRANARVEAASQFELIRQSIDAGKTSEADTLTDSLVENHGDTAYAVFAMTLRAQRQIDAGKADKAVESLQWAVKHAKSKPLQDLTRIRLARAQLAAGQSDQALVTLDALPAEAFQGMASELRGDAQVELGKGDDAVKSYRKALAAYKPDAPQRHTLEMKIDSLSSVANHKDAGKPTAASASSSEKQDA